MDGVITYLNTDLDVVSAGDLQPLIKAFRSGRMFPLDDVSRGDDGLGYVTFETRRQYSEPEANIAAMLAVVEALPAAARRFWDGCTKREFNIGYDCGQEPWAFQQGLSAGLLVRIASVGASMRWTLYPDPPDGLWREGAAEGR